MTKIDFYTHTENKIQTACVVAAKAVASGNKVMVYTPGSDVSEKLDKLMWTYPEIGFAPHCKAEDKLAGITPVIIDHLAERFLHDDILINLRVEQPVFFTRFKNLVEIVSLEESDRQLARGRYRFYRDRGYEINSYDVRKHPGFA